MPICSAFALSVDVPRQISYDVAPATVSQESETLSVDVPCDAVSPDGASIEATATSTVTLNAAAWKPPPCYGEEYTLRQNVPMEKRMEQKAALDGKIGYID